MKSNKKIAVVLALILLCSPAVGFAEQPFDIPVPELFAATTDISKAKVLPSYEKSAPLFASIYYRDIRGIFGHEAVVRMTAYGVLNTYGERDFRPANSATGYDVASALVRAKGLENKVMERVMAQSGASTTPAELAVRANKEYLAEAITAGIVGQEQAVWMPKAMTRERAAQWIARAMGVDTSVGNQTYQFADWDQVNPTMRGAVEALLKNKVITLENSGVFSPKKFLSRAEMAVWLKGAVEEMAAPLAIERQFGLIIGVKEKIVVAQGRRIKEKTITVKNVDSTVTQLVSSRIEGASVDKEYVTYKEGIISSSKNLSLGDQIEYVTLGGVTRYVKVVDDSSVLEKIELAREQSPLYSVTHFGTVSEIWKQKEMREGASVIKEIYRINDVSGDVFDIVVYENSYSGMRDDIITFKNGQIGGVKLLAVGDVLEYLVNDRREVDYIKVGALDKQYISGTVREVSAPGKFPATITIFGYDNRIHRFDIAPYANLSINLRTTTLDNFVYGMPIKVEVDNGRVIHALGESTTETPGYIPAFGKMRMGTVRRVVGRSFIMQLDGGKELTVDTDRQTQITKDSNHTNLLALKAGESVKVYYDAIHDTVASRVEIEAPELLFDIIYKGKIRDIVAPRREIQLIGRDGISKPEYIKNDKWVQAEDYTINLQYDPNTKIYVGNKEIDPTLLERYYSNYQAYAVVKKVYGKPTVVSLSVKTGGEMLYSSSIGRIDHTRGAFDILTRENFNITKGTIVVKDGLVVPSSELKSRDTVLVASESPNGSYEKQAMFVKVTTAHENIFDRIRIGVVDVVHPSGITFNNHTQYVNNMIDEVTTGKSGQYKFFTSSVIKDVTDSERVKHIIPKMMWHDQYGISENVDTTYSPNTAGLRFKRYYAFSVVNPADNSIVAMNLRHKGLLPADPWDDRLRREPQVTEMLSKAFDNAMLSRGIVTGRDTTWERIELTDSHDFTNYTGRWTANGTNIYVKYKDAIIIKNNTVITKDDIEMGDYLYVMRLGAEALVIFVE